MDEKDKVAPEDTSPPNESVRIIKLVTGEMLVSFSELLDDEDGVLLLAPFITSYVTRGEAFVMVLRPWLPLELILENSCVISICDILTTMIPTDEFIEFYKNVMKSYEKVKEPTDRNISVIKNESATETKHDVEQIPISTGKVTFH